MTIDGRTHGNPKSKRGMEFRGNREFQSLAYAI
jgi:hypothetical protein